MSKRFLAIALVLCPCIWSMPAMGLEKSFSEEEGTAFTRLPVSWSVNPRDAAAARQAWQTLRSFHQGKPASKRALHVVYVTFRDRPALDRYRERYDHLLKNIQAYYADQMQANGYPPLTFGLDLDEKGRLVVHDAYVDTPVSALNVRNSGPVSREAAKKVLAARGIDIEKEHVLIVCQLPDGVGPYYGGGFSHQGTGWTCDQEGLDPASFRETAMMEGGRYKVTKGQNATIYIGGTAHELGHAFGLPHTGTGWDYPQAGKSLMGDGNFEYGSELRKGKGAFLSPTDAMKLASIPLFNGVETPFPGDSSYGRVMGRFVPGAFEHLEAQPVKDGLRLTGKVKMLRPAYGVVVHLDPPGGSDYDTNAVGTALGGDGSFDVTICRPGYRGGFIEMRVAVLNCDSTRSMTTLPVWLDEKGAMSTPTLGLAVYFSDVQRLWAQGRLNEAVQALKEVERQYGNLPDVKRWLAVWQRVLDRQTPAEKPAPDKIPTDTNRISLNDCKPAVAQVGWAVPMWDALFASDLGPVPFFKEIGCPDRFILAHAPAVFAYDLNGAWKAFSADVGLPFGSSGSVRFRVLLDGRQLVETPVLEGGSSVPVKVPVEGGRRLEIRVDDGGDGNSSDWGIIANGMLSR